jgi:hypothetical protein
MILDLLRRIERLELQDTENHYSIAEYPTHTFLEYKHKKIIYFNDMKQQTWNVLFYYTFLNTPVVSFCSETLKPSLYVKHNLQKDFFTITNNNFIPITGIIIIEGI